MVTPPGKRARFRESDETRDISLVAVSGMSRGVDISTALAAGFDAYVAKPLDIDKLRAEIIAALGRRRVKRQISYDGSTGA